MYDIWNIARTQAMKLRYRDGYARARCRISAVETRAVEGRRCLKPRQIQGSNAHQIASSLKRTADGPPPSSFRRATGAVLGVGFRRADDRAALHAEPGRSRPHRQEADGVQSAGVCRAHVWHALSWPRA